MTIENRYVSMGTHPKSRLPLDFGVRGNPFASKTAITITLDANSNRTSPNNTQYVHSYSTLDEINGVVTILPRCDISYDDLEISMLGKSLETFACDAPSTDLD